MRSTLYVTPIYLFLIGAIGCNAQNNESLGAKYGLTLAPPTQGFQLTMGPFAVPLGEEVQLCRTLKLTNDQPVAVHEFTSQHTLGSHHQIVFASDLDFPDQDFPCWGTINFDNWKFLVDFQQKQDTSWTLPDGDAIILNPHQQLMIQSHFVNATTVKTPIAGFSVYNLGLMPMDQVKNRVAGIFTVNTNVDIPPHSSFVNQRDCLFNQPVELIAMTGHFHARGTDFRVWNLDQQHNPIGDPIYDGLNWDNEPFLTWEPGLLAQSGLRFSCTYFNDTDNTILWGAHADVQEHCNLFFQYRPMFEGAAPALTCKNGSGGW
jgi:hypothetical protein